MSAVILSSDPEAGEQEGGRRLVSSASQILHPDSLEGPKALPSALCQPASLVSHPTCHPVEPFVSRLCVPACYTVPILMYPFIFPRMFFVFMLTWRTPIHTSKARSQIISSRDERKQDPFHPFLNSPSAIRKGRVRSPLGLPGRERTVGKWSQSLRRAYGAGITVHMSQIGLLTHPGYPNWEATEPDPKPRRCPEV